MRWGKEVTKKTSWLVYTYVNIFIYIYLRTHTHTYTHVFQHIAHTSRSLIFSCIALMGSSPVVSAPLLAALAGKMIRNEETGMRV